MNSMTDKPYLNREIDEKFKDIMDGLGRIERQTTKTNGRVDKLEGWRDRILGFCTCITVLLLPIVFMAINYIISLWQA